MLYPFAWLILSSFKTAIDIVRIPPSLFPDPWTWEPYQTVLTYPIGGSTLLRSYANSIIVTVVTVVIVLFTSTLGGYVFARLKFPGREFLFYFVLSTTMVPFLTLLIPLYIVIDRLQLLNSLWGLIVPAIFSSFGIFLCRQFVYGIPVELYDAAKIDGAGDFTIYSRIIVGMMKPVISVLAIFTFRGTFNAYLWPLVVLADAKKYTLPLALRGMSNTFGQYNYSVIMAGSVLTLIPPLIVFFIFQRNLVKGIALTGIKG
jgi:ABC-type glycerol-3-phosphate transport system permease component